MKIQRLSAKMPKKFSNIVFSYWLPVLTAVLFFALLGVSVFNLIYRTKVIRDEIISSDVKKLSEIFKKINNDCKISGFDYQKNNVDFLTVEKFTGSEIGPMNLVYPNNWKGPYLNDNLAIQNRVYQVAKTKHGYFLVPGDNVTLSDGKIIGKDIKFEEHTDVPSMISKGGALYREKPLALKIEISKSTFSKMVDRSLSYDGVVTQGTGWF